VEVGSTRHKDICGLLKKWRQVEKGREAADSCTADMLAFLRLWMHTHSRMVVLANLCLFEKMVLESQVWFKISGLVEMSEILRSHLRICPPNLSAFPPAWPLTEWNISSSPEAWRREGKEWRVWGEENGGEGERKKVVEGTEEREERDARLLCAEWLYSRFRFMLIR
jgi:hypothetical protein